MIPWWPAALIGVFAVFFFSLAVKIAYTNEKNLWAQYDSIAAEQERRAAFLEENGE